MRGQSDAAAERLRVVLDRDASAKLTTTNLSQLTGWARAAGLEPLALAIPAASLPRLRLPAVAHLAPSHFVAVFRIDDESVTFTDGTGIAQTVPRKGFDECFSGYVLCFGGG